MSRNSALLIDWLIDCCLMPSEEYFSSIDWSIDCCLMPSEEYFSSIDWLIDCCLMPSEEYFSSIDWLIDCCLMPSEEYFSYSDYLELIILNCYCILDNLRNKCGPLDSGSMPAPYLKQYTLKPALKQTLKDKSLSTSVLLHNSIIQVTLIFGLVWISRVDWTLIYLKGTCP